MFEGEYFYLGEARWNLGWATPNFAGAFLATIVCFTWIGRRSKWLHIISYITEACLLFALAKTYSRGALVAVVCGAVFYFGFNPDRSRTLLLTFLFRAFFLAIVIWSTNFAGRITPNSMGSDLSVLNRLELWKGGLLMVKSAPVMGWGLNSSGQMFMNWFQATDRSEIYSTMVNSYLHIAVEHGLLVLLVVLWLLAFTISFARFARNGKSDLCLAAASSVLAWAVANIFSTLWLEERLWLVPTFSIGILLGSIKYATHTQLRCHAVMTFQISAVCCAIIFGGSIFASVRRAVGVTPISPSVVQYANETVIKTKAWQIWPDEAILGEAPGKALRNWVSALNTPTKILVYSDLATFDRRVAAPRTMLFGKHATRLSSEYIDEIEAGRVLVVVHPTTPPPKLHHPHEGRTVLILPEIDEIGNTPAWLKWAKTMQAEVRYSKNCGLDIRSAWPNVVIDAAEF